MDSVKERLRVAIESLSEEDARAVWDLVQALLQDRGVLHDLALNPIFTIPREGFTAFPDVTPAVGQGVLASALLVDDRR